MVIKKNRIVVLLMVAIITIASIFVYNRSNSMEEISYNEFLSRVENGNIDQVQLNNSSKIKVTFKDGTEVTTDNPRNSQFKEQLLFNDISVVEESNSFETILMPMIILFSLFGSLIYIRKSSGKEAEKEMANMSNMENDDYDVSITFDDVAGNEEAKESLKEIVDYMNNVEKYKEFGVRMPRGILLYGPPGTGKTLLAKALAGDAKVPFFPVAGSDFVQVYAGLGASRIRDLFKKAKEAEKSVIFIDEIDSIGKKRKGSNASGSEEGDRTLNALLAEMSGFKENEGVMVIAATNRLDVLDEALLRPGRFDRQIEVQLPDINARQRILKLHGENKPIGEEVDFQKLAAETVYFSGAKLESLMNEAAIYAVKDKSDKIRSEHIDKAYYKVLVGDEKFDRSSIDKQDKEITAYHEAGHALVAKLVAPKNRVTKVSIIPSTKGIGGFSLNIPVDRSYSTKKDLCSNIMIALGGRAAEEIIFGSENITTGASSDLEKATEITLSMVGNLGMDQEFGLLNMNSLFKINLNENQDLINRTKDNLNTLYSDTIDILKRHRIQLSDLAEALMEKETLNEEEIEDIINKMQIVLEEN